MKKIITRLSLDPSPKNSTLSSSQYFLIRSGSIGPIISVRLTEKATSPFRNIQTMPVTPVIAINSSPKTP